MSGATIETLLGPEFRLALLIGTVAAVACGLLGLVWRRRGAGPAPIGGLVLATAGVVALGAGATPRRLVLGLVVLAVAGLVPSTSPLPRMLGWLAGVAGGWLAISASAVGLTQGWIVLATAVVVCLAIAMSRADEVTRSAAIGLPLFALSVVGVFFAVPDTEDALLLLGVSLPMAVNGWPVRLASLGSAGAHVLAGLSVWTIIRGGYVRPSSMVGALACVALVAAISIGWRNAGKRSQPLEVLGVIAFHLGLVFVASRVVAVQSVGLAGALAAALLLLALIIGRGVARLGRDRTDGGARRG